MFRFKYSALLALTLALTLALNLVPTTVRAADSTIELRDYTGRGFAPDIVNYRVPAAGAAKLRVINADGTPLATQVTPSADKKWATLSFVTDLPANGARSLVVKSVGALAPTQVSARATPAGLELANGLFTIRVPAVTEQSFKTPVPASSLPAPLLGFKRNPAGPWSGTGKVLATRPVKSLKVSLTARGPVFAEAKYELQFAAGGFYRATVRVEDNVPVAKISEEYDPGVMDGTDSWEFNLATGWNADRMEVASTAGNGVVDPGRVDPLEKLQSKPSWYLVPDSAWGPPLSQLGIFNDAAQKADADNYPMAGVVPLHKGDWRNMNALEVQSTATTDVRVRFPMSRRNASWLREVTSETSLFSMQEHEPGQSRTYGRRHWGLVLGKPAATTVSERGGPLGPFYLARLFYGVVGLDAYKDFVLDWADTGVKYPRVYLKAAEAARYKEQLQASVLPEDFKKKLLEGTIALGATEPVAAAKLKATLGRLAYITRAPMVSPTTGHHWTAPQYTTAAGTDDVLGWSGLSAEARRDIRARVALICYLWQNADVISYANGSHSGNPNMGTARFSPMVSFLPLVPDHPMFAQWRTHMAQYLEYKATSQIAPGGGYFEYGVYHMHSYSRVMNVLPALKAAEAKVSDHMLDADLQDWRYYLNLLTPVDSRWKYRVYPGMANSAPGYTENLAEAAGAVVGRDPELAANLLWAWLANGANDRNDPLMALNGILVPAGLQPKEPALTSAIYPGVGVIFRAHQGPDETYMFLRSGNNWSHWPEDQGHMVLMSRGATLLPFQPYQYWGVKDKNFEDKNLLRFGSPENKMPHAWPDSNILDHAFGPSVDYAWSSTGFPDWYISPGSTPEFSGKVEAPVGTGAERPLADIPGQKQGAFTWDRQVLFLKGSGASSPNYFVVRDSTSGAGQLANWFNLNLLGPKSNVKVEDKNLLVDTEWPVKLDLRFANAAPLKPDFYEELQFVSLGGHSGPSWWRKEGPVSPNWVKQDGSPQPADIGRNTSPNFYEKHTMVRLQGAPGSGYLWAIYPRKADEPAPVVTTPATGVLKVEHPEGVDYAFLSAAPMRYDAEEILFEGCAGAVRVARDGKITLALTSGTGRVGYKGAVLAGTAPLEKTFAAGGATTTPPPVSAFATALPTMLTGHTALLPGVLQASSNGTTEYLVQAASATERVQAAQFGFNFEATRAQIYTDGKTVRFVVPDATYARLSLGNVGVRGVGPFDLTFAADKISGKVEGATRTLVTTFPPAITRPMYRMDGNRWFAGWADDHSIVKGTTTPQFGIGFGVTKGQHTVEISEWTYPDLPPTVERTALGG